MTGFEPRTYGIESDRSTNWATTVYGPVLSTLTFIFQPCHIKLQLQWPDSWVTVDLVKDKHA